MGQARDYTPLFCLLLLSVSVGGYAILPLGDSITFGCGDPCIGNGYDCTQNATLDCPSPFTPSCHGGYRPFLWQLLNAAGKEVSFVGPFENGPATITQSNRHHAGYSGAAIGPSTNDWNLFYYLPTWSSFRPDFILLMIGTNDLWAYHTGEQLEEDITVLLNATFTVLPTTTILVSSVLNMPEVSTYPGALQYYNNALAKLPAVFTPRGLKLFFVDANRLLGMCSAWPNTDCCKAYDVHPSGPGYEKLAHVWFQALVPLL